MTTFQYLTLNELGKEFDLQVIRDLIKEKEKEPANKDTNKILGHWVREKVKCEEFDLLRDD